MKLWYVYLWGELVIVRAVDKLSAVRLIGEWLLDARDSAVQDEFILESLAEVALDGESGVLFAPID